jgi:hypothetical protein
MTTVEPSTSNMTSGTFQRRTILLTRIVIILALWAASGWVVYANYRTDACPPEVKEREALVAAMWSPIVMTDAVSQMTKTFFLNPVTGLGYLLAGAASAFMLLRARTLNRLRLATTVLSSLCAFGAWCVIYMSAHPVG